MLHDLVVSRSFDRLQVLEGEGGHDGSAIFNSIPFFLPRVH
jgi:hypothetical protein